MFFDKLDLILFFINCNLFLSLKIDIEVLLRALSISGEEVGVSNYLIRSVILINFYFSPQEIDKLDLTEADRSRLKHHFAAIRSELEMDSDELQLRNELTRLEEDLSAGDQQLTGLDEEKEVLLRELEELNQQVDIQQVEQNGITGQLRSLEQREGNSDRSILDTVQTLIQQNEQMKQREQQFKESCRRELAELEQCIEEGSKEEGKVANADDVEQLQGELQRELDQLQAMRIHAAKQNRQLTTVQRQLDNIPDRTELAQYQKRFLELYTQVSAKHRETKQFFSLYNTLSQTRTCLDKELSLLNSIFDSFQQ